MKTYFKGQAKTEDNVEDAAYKVDVTITKREVTKSFKDKVFTFGLQFPCMFLLQVYMSSIQLFL